MSLLLVLFYFIGIPALVIVVAVWLWRKTDSSLARGLVMTGAMATLAGLLWLAQGEKWQADRQARELCAKDGGVRVYETVTLPAEKLDEHGRPNFRIPYKAEVSPTDEYYYEEIITYIQSGNPSLQRSEYRYVRQGDGKVMGTSVFYSRGGGGLPGPWHEPPFICPDPVKQRTNLITEVFVKGDDK